MTLRKSLNTELKDSLKEDKYSKFDAAKSGDIECLKNINKKELTEKSANGETLLYIAITNNQLKVVKFIIENSASVEFQSQLALSLHQAILSGNFSIFKYLVDGPAKQFINVRNPIYGNTPLECATEEGHLEFVKYLVGEAKAEIIVHKGFPTLLHLAIENNHLAIVKYLIRGSAKTTLEPFFTKFYIFKNPDQEDINFHPPLHQAAAEGDLETVKCLIEEAKINPHAVNQENLTPLEFAICEGEPNDNLLAVIRYLIPKTKLRFGNTPLHWAVEEKKTAIVKMLVEQSKTDIHAKNMWGLSPFDHAQGHIKKYLESKKKPPSTAPIEQKEYKLPDFFYHTHTPRRKSWCEYDNKIFKKENRLGGGKCGEVYAFIEDKQSNEENEIKLAKIAVKRTLPIPEFRPLNLRQEAECFHTVYGLGGYDFDSKHQSAFTAMPLISGKSLDHINITTLADFFKISIAMVKALNELHIKHKIVHCDLNQGNFMIEQSSSGDFIAKLIDFGFSVKIGQLLPHHLFLNEHSAPHYAPEVGTPIPADPKQDIFTLGYILLYTLYNKSRLPTTQRPSYLKKMLAENPNERPSLADIQHTLEFDYEKLQLASIPEAKETMRLVRS